MKKPIYKRPGFYAISVGVLLLAAIVIPTLGSVAAPATKARDLSNIRQIGQASIIYASEHNDRFPEATDVWDYARQLAESDLLDDAAFWQSRLDPAHASRDRSIISVLAPTGNQKARGLNPAFRQIKPSIAIPLGKLTSSMPATMPIAWTRGLQSDGTWAKHSPYGGEGGYIVFAAANVAFFRSLQSPEGGELLRYDGKGPTANILEALPPGTLIGEYRPTSEEASAWVTTSKNPPSR